MWLHIPSALVGSAVSGAGFLLIHRELSHRRRLTTKWEIQEYAEESWKEWRKSAADTTIADSAKVSCSYVFAMMIHNLSIYLDDTIRIKLLLFYRTNTTQHIRNKQQ